MGETTLSDRATKEFFVKFENHEVLDADLQVDFEICKSVEYVDIDCDVDGTITVACDRCLSPVAMPVSASGQFRLRLKGSGVTIDPSCEEVFLPEGSDQLDLNQEVYDFALLALPLQRFHNEGDCDKVALDYLSKGEMEVAQEVTDSPFANLADMLKRKN